MIWVTGRRWGTAAEIAAALGPDVTVTTVRWWARAEGLTAVRHRDDAGRPQVRYPLDEAAAIEAAKRQAGRGRPRQQHQGSRPTRPEHDTVVTQNPHTEETAAMHPDSLPIVAATVTLMYADQSMTTIDIHEGAAIGVDLSQQTDNEPRDYTDSPRPGRIGDRLRMELRASSVQGGGEFVTLTRTPGRPRRVDSVDQATS